MTYVPTLRPPTGQPAAPLVMVSGVPKSGKSVAAYKIGNHPKIHATYVLDLGEGTADEYGTLAPYSVLDWGSSWSDLADTIRWCVAQPVPEGSYTAVIVDSGSEIWDGLKNRATQRARSSRSNRRRLEEDPDAEIDVSMNYWNDAATTWANIVNPLRIAGHVIGVILVRAEEVAEVTNGAPTNRRVTSLHACPFRGLPSMATAHVRVTPDHVARLVEVRSINVTIPTGGLELDDANPLGHLLDLLAPAGTLAAPSIRTPQDLERDDPERTAYWDDLKARYRALAPATGERARDLLTAAGFLHAETRVPLTPFTLEQLTQFDAILGRAISEIEAELAEVSPS